ncbi:TetR/AcrR family transcriptional regulator [Planctobacterium marinum]|uniref:TetR/AcrR family transcriptional regulator n=1 Tax=Planctobacterium marinum TaxID=1631968 RepID=UPI001E5CD605|nr:TetR/AcrR family transcriptional regulator [Planctobacterium marinum]MCC2604622.1 TetR/AcrR family transcriptional regulator [Planctobacterium marinum]
MRSAEFDKEQVLRAAIVAFATKGYSQTSMLDLKKATGLHPGSIYCAFENKQGLLLCALQQYSDDRSKEFVQLFENAPSVKEGLRRYLNKTVQDLTQQGHQCVCLSQKALSEMAQVNPVVEKAVAENIAGWHQGFVNVLQTAIQHNEIDSSRSAEQRGRYLAMGITGLRIYAQSNNDPGHLAELAQQLLEDVYR